MFVAGIALLTIAVGLSAWYGGIWVESFLMSEHCWPIVRRLAFSALALMFLSGLLRAVL